MQFWKNICEAIQIVLNNFKIYWTYSFLLSDNSYFSDNFCSLEKNILVYFQYLLFGII